MTERNPVRCDDCNTRPELYRTEKNTLSVACDCHDQPVKVATATPDGWSL